MAFNLEECYGYGRGHNFTDFETTAGQVSRDFNSYAALSDISANLITIDIDNAYVGQFGSFKAGEVILIHASASPTLQTDKLGKFICAKIEVADSGKLKLDKDISATFTAEDLENYCVQAVTFAEFHCLKVSAKSAIQPQIYSTEHKHGGILAVKVSDTLTLDGDIDLTDCGISTYQKDYLRPLTDQELHGELDADERSGEENYCINNIFLLNSGDGAAFIFAKKIVATDDARIGNPATHGKIFCRGAEDSPYKPSNVTNVGGSSILLATDEPNYSTLNFAKYRTSSESDAKKGKGLARCYIATKVYSTCDDALFHADIISDYARISTKHYITDFGDGRHGDIENPTFRLNEVQTLHRISDFKAEFLLKPKKGLANFAVGTKCLIICNYFPVLNEITALEGDVVTFKNKLADEVCSCITVPEVENFALNQDFDISDIFALFVKDKCKISAKIKATSFIFARELEVASGAWLGDKVFCVYNSLTGELASAVPEGSLTFAKADY